MKPVILKTLKQLAVDFLHICPNCDRLLPNLKWRKKIGCKWCIK